MTTFKNNSKYAELMLQYLDYAVRDDTPLSVVTVLQVFRWKFKGGSLRAVSEATRLQPEVSWDSYPHGESSDIAAEWPEGKQARALAQVLRRRARQPKQRSLDGTLGTWLLLTARYGLGDEGFQIYTGMQAIYRCFSMIWPWSLSSPGTAEWDSLGVYTREICLAATACSRMDLPSVERIRSDYWSMLSTSRVPALLQAVLDLKKVISKMNSSEVQKMSRTMGKSERESLPPLSMEIYMGQESASFSDWSGRELCIRMKIGPLSCRVSHRVVLVTTGRIRVALSMSDLERLHQMTMAATSALVGCLAQAVVGTSTQISRAIQSFEVADRCISRIVASSLKVPLGDEVLVCKGYRRAYTAHLGVLAGPLCKAETEILTTEAKETAGPGVLDIDGYMDDLACLDAAGSLNAGKVFKMCPAPDVSPGGAMMDRISQIGNCNIMDPTIMADFRAELTSQILRARIRSGGPRLPLRPNVAPPEWYQDYLRGDFNLVPSDDIAETLVWEGSSKIPDVSPYDARMWKDAGLGADTIEEAEQHQALGHKKNMLMRLLFDPDCPMPGRMELSDEHVIKFFIKAEGHKEPARGIFSANLTDRQAQSWMELGVERIAKHHPSFMIGASSDVRDLKVQELTRRPARGDYVPLYYSFDISGWSAKMPAEPQRISHSIWAKLYGGHLYGRAPEINEDSYIYLSLDGYFGWFRNTASNLEGFNGKEMTMVLVALLSLSVKVWRKRVVEAGVLTGLEAQETVALLFAYIDDGLSRIDLPASSAIEAFELYKTCVIETFSRCGFCVETSKCFPSDRFAIFLNEVYLGGRHVVHGVRAAMGISAEPTERHTTLVERLTTVSTGCRGAVMAGLDPMSALLVMAYHSYLHIREWVGDESTILWAVWAMLPRAWGGLGMPNMLQLSVSGSGSAFEESVATVQAWARVSRTAKAAFLALCRTALETRTAVSVLTAPLSARVPIGYMVDSRVASTVRDALKRKLDNDELSPYAVRLLKYSDIEGFGAFAEAVVPLSETEVLQEQMLDNVYEAHPHSIFSSFAKRVEKSATVSSILGHRLFQELVDENRKEAKRSLDVLRGRVSCYGIQSTKVSRQ